MSATALKARSALAGNDLYQQRGRRALPILVRQARAGVALTYARLADELEMPNVQNTNYVLGAAGRAVADHGMERGVRIPPLTAIVVNQGTGLPSDGVAEFLERPEEYLHASPELKWRIVDRLYLEMAAFRGWEEMLQGMGVEPVESLLTDPRPVRGGGGEGEAHRHLKEYIAEHPDSVGLGRRARLVRTEAPLSSGDEVDVLFTNGTNYIAIEVKTSEAGISEIERGMYQCVKYAAVLRAMQKAVPSTPSAEAWLALGGTLPMRLLALRNTLGITVLEEVGPA